MKEYQTIVLNGYSTKHKIDALLQELADQGFTIHSTIMGNIIILERDKDVNKTSK